MPLALGDHVDLLSLLVGAQLLVDPRRDLEPVDREVSRAELARVHENVRTQPMNLGHGRVGEAPDEHAGFLADAGRGGVAIQRTTRLTSLPGTTISFRISLPSRNS